VLVKEYVEGLTVDEVRAAARRGAVDLDESDRGRVALRRAIRPYFRGGAFREWLKAKGVDPKTFGYMEKLVDEGDVKEDNFLLTDRGWVLNDP
jgi:hypothetical protein